MYNNGMSKTGYIYRSFVTTAEIEAYLEARASRDDRSISSTIRRIIEAEMARDPVRVTRENGRRTNR